MKTQILILMMTVLTLSTNVNAKAVSVIKNAKSLIVETSGWKSKNVKVQIKEFSGNIILDEILTKSSGSRKYNLVNLPDGQYSIELSSDLKITVRNFEVNGTQVNLSPEMQTIFKPVLNWTGKTLDINLLTMGTSTTISILDEKGNTVLSQTNQNPAIHKRFNIAALPAGDYSVNIETNGRYFDFNYTK